MNDERRVPRRYQVISYNRKKGVDGGVNQNPPPFPPPVEDGLALGLRVAGLPAYQTVGAG